MLSDVEVSVEVALEVASMMTWRYIVKALIIQNGEESYYIIIINNYKGPYILIICLIVSHFLTHFEYKTENISK